MKLARFAGGEFYQDDASKRGFVGVEFDGNIIRAYPANETMWLAVPSREWIEKYGDSLWALIERFEDDPRYWCWCGVAILVNPQTEDESFTEWLADYPYVRMYFTENWKYIFNDTEGRNTYRITHEDGTVVLIDRTTGEESIRIFDGVSRHEILLDPGQIRVTHGQTGAVITLDADGNIRIEAPEKARIVTGDDAEIVVGNDASIDARGDVEVRAGGFINLDAGSRSGGLITTKSIDPYTGFNHIDGSSSVRATK